MPNHDARKIQRYPAFLGASISCAQKTTIFDCLVKNISDKGALIKIERIWDVPESFRLYIDKYDKSFHCRVQWKTFNRLGVNFS